MFLKQLYHDFLSGFYITDINYTHLESLEHVPHSR